MERLGYRVPAAVLELVKDESALTWEKLAREMDCTLKSTMRWRTKGFSLDVAIALLRLATERGLERSEMKLIHALREACGPNVQIALVARNKRRTA